MTGGAAARPRRGTMLKMIQTIACCWVRRSSGRAKRAGSSMEEGGSPADGLRIRIPRTASCDRCEEVVVLRDGARAPSRCDGCEGGGPCGAGGCFC